MAYTADIFGLLCEIRDLLNTGNASVAKYPQTEFGLWQGIRDFAVANGIGGGGGDPPALPDGFSFLVNADGSYILNVDSNYLIAAN